MNLQKEMLREGVKPALLVTYKRGRKGERHEYTNIFNELSSEYPYIVFEHRNNVLFFNDELTKEWFEVNGCECYYSKKLGKWIQDYKHDVLGYVLGFPPSAVSYFKEKMYDAPKAGDRVSVVYYGIQFICHPFDVDNCINWLKTYRPVPERIKNLSGIFVTEKYKVPDKDKTNLRGYTVKSRTLQVG